MGSTEELCPGCSGQCPSCGRDIQGAELSEIRQALEASRAETREAREQARLDATAAEQQYLSLKEIHDASGRAYDNTIADRDQWRLRAETAEGHIRAMGTVRLDSGEENCPCCGKPVDLCDEEKDETCPGYRGRAFLAGRGGSQAAPGFVASCNLGVAGCVFHHACDPSMATHYVPSLGRAGSPTARPAATPTEKGGAR